MLRLSSSSTTNFSSNLVVVPLFPCLLIATSMSKTTPKPQKTTIS